MKHLIHILIAFVLGLGLGAYYGRSTVKDRAVDIVSQAYENGIESAVKSGGEQLQKEGQNIAGDITNQIKLKAEEKIKEEINSFVGSIFN